MILLKSLVTLNLDAKVNAGWCLSLQQKVFGTPVANPHATAAWNNAKYKNTSREMPNVAVPVFFKWVNNIKGDPNYGVDQGHVVAWVPGRGFFSSPGVGYGSTWFDSIVAIEKYFGCTYRGWAQDLNGKRVAEPLPVQPPVVVAPPVTTGNGGDYYLDVEVNGYATSAQAAAREGSNSRVPAGGYKIFNEANGVVNITHDASQPGWWINPADDVAPAPAPAAPAFAVGDVVVPTNPVSYDGVHLKQWDPTYTISELNGDRAVLVARGAVWAAINVANIRKA